MESEITPRSEANGIRAFELSLSGALPVCQVIDSCMFDRQVSGEGWLQGFELEWSEVEWSDGPRAWSELLTPLISISEELRVNKMRE